MNDFSSHINPGIGDFWDSLSEDQGNGLISNLFKTGDSILDLIKANKERKMLAEVMKRKQAMLKHEAELAKYQQSQFASGQGGNSKSNPLMILSVALAAAALGWGIFNTRTQQLRS